MVETVGVAAVIWFVIWALCSIGLTHVLADSHLMEVWPKSGIATWLQEERKAGNQSTWKFRFWETLLFGLYCYQCSGWWAGLVTGLMMDPAGGSGTWAGWLGRGLAYAFVSSFLAPLAAAAINYLDVVRVKKN